MHRYTYPKSLTSAGSSGYYAYVFGSVSNMSLLTIGDYYYYSHNKMETRHGYRMGIDRCNRLCPTSIMA